MKRSGQYISQLSGYKAFIPSSLPPNPSVKMDEAMNQLLSEANIALGQKISSPSAIGLLDYLFVKPHISTHEVAEHFQMSFQTAQTLINHFVEIEILREITGKKRDRRYSYWQYLEYLSEGTTP